MSETYTANWTYRPITLKAVVITKENDYLITYVQTVEIMQADGSFLIHHPDRFFSEDGSVLWIDRVDHKRNVVYYREDA